MNQLFMYFSENVIVNFTTVTHKVYFCESSFYEPKKGASLVPSNIKSLYNTSTSTY